MKLSGQDFSLSGALGSFRLPPGESRVGSDAACEICIRGDGILPIHAYLRADGEKILIRPANPESSTDRSRAAITVEGSLITGPATVLSGQSLSIGQIHLRLQRNLPARGSWLSRGWVRVLGYSAAGVVMLAVLSFLYVRFVVLGDDALRQYVKDAVHETLGRQRDEVEIEKIDVRFFSGQVEFTNLKIKERFDFQPAAPHAFVQLPSLVVKMDLWPMLSSLGRTARNVSIKIDKDIGNHVPEIIIERSKADGALNIEDIVQKINSGQGGKLPLSHLNFELTVQHAALRLHDPYTFSETNSETSLENISLTARMNGEGQPIVIEKCEMTASAVPAPPDPGALSLTGRINAIDDTCAIDASKISAELLELKMDKFDLARVFEHFGYAWEPHNSNLKVVLGKPISGKVEASFSNPRDIVLSGAITSDSLVSIKEDAQTPLGNFPMKLKCSELRLVKDAREGAPFVPKKMDLKLESWSDTLKKEPPFLTFSSKGELNPSNGTSTYGIELNCGLRQLVDTDVGHRLKLDGSLGGTLTGKADLVVDANNGLKIMAKFDGNDAYVMVPDPDDATNPPARKRQIRQPIKLSFDCIGNVQRDDRGELDNIDVSQFSLVASSFEACSESASRIDFSRKEEPLAAQAKFKLDLHGRELCREFSPILSLFGFKKPLEEDFALEVGIIGKKNRIEAHAVGTAKRQWSPDPAPVKVEVDVVFNKLMNETDDAKLMGAMPYLSLSLHTYSMGDKQIDVAVEAHCTRRDGCKEYELIGMKDGRDTGKPGLEITADIGVFSDRFRPYIEWFLKPSEGSSKAVGPLDFYRDNDVAGTISHKGRIKIKRVSNEAQNRTDHVDFELDTAANFTARPRHAEGREPGPGAIALAEWAEPKLSLNIAGSYEQIFSENHEEPDKMRQLNIEKLNVAGSLGQFDVSVRDLDLMVLPTLRTAPGKAWTDALAGMNVKGTISPQATVLLKTLRILDPSDPVSGTLDLEVAFDRKKDSLDLKKFDFHESGGFYVSELNASGTLAKVKSISARLFPTQPNDSTLAERAAGWLDESGPSAFFDHLGNELTIHSLLVDAKPFREWLAGAFKDGVDGRKVPAMFAGILDKTWEPTGVWSARQMQLARDPNLPDTWRLNGVFRSDLTATAPFAGDSGACPVLTFAKPWRVALGLSLSKSSAAAMSGEIGMNETAIRASVPALKFDFEKPAGEPFKIELESCASTHGAAPTSIGKIHVTGSFGDFEIANFFTQPDRPGLQFSVEKFGLKSAGLECSGAIANFDLRGDKLEARAESPSLELRGLPELWVLAPLDAQSSGRLKNASFSYKGGMTALLASMPPKLRPALEANDARRFGIQPESDAFELEGDLDGVRIGVSKENALDLGGRVRISPGEFACKNFTVEIRGLYPASAPGAPEPQRIQKFTIPQLRVKSSDPKLNLRQAVAAAGLPLEMSGEIACDKPLTAEQAAVLGDAAVKRRCAGAPGAGRMDWPAVSKLFANGSFKAPALAFGPVALDNFEMRNAVFKDLKLSFPVLTVSYLGGRLKLEDTEYDFSKMAAKSGLISEMKGWHHSQHVNLTDADLCQLLGSTKADSVRYAICGKFGAQGPFSGVDLAPLDRLSWSGALKLDLANFSIGAPIVPTKGDAVPPLPWMDYFKHHAAGRATVLARASLADTVAPLEVSITAGAPVSNAANVFDGVLACAELYFAKVFGVEAVRVEFETFSPTVRIDKGLAVFEPFELKGKGACAGFDIQVRNLKINLTDESFADEALIYPTALPPDAQERLSLQKWPPRMSELFLASMSAGKLPMRLSGPLAAPSVKFPWMETRAFARSALFGVDGIMDMDSLTKAREHFFKFWGKDDATLAAAAMLADRHTAGLPGTLSSRLAKESVVDRAVKLPPKIMDALALNSADSPATPLLTPLESLTMLLFAEPEPVAPPPVPVPTPNPNAPAPNPAKTTPVLGKPPAEKTNVPNNTGKP